MNEVIQLLNNHSSYRSYSDKPVTEEQTEAIVKAAMSAANWANCQQVTVIEVRDQARKSKLTELVGNQKWVDEAPVFFVFCLDYNRAKLAGEKHGQRMNVTNTVEAITIGATDVGIALANAIAASESLGLGTVPIGGIRANPAEVIELLDLPEYVFPISGLVVGHPNEEAAQKPRLPLEAVHHKETYNHDQNPLIDAYDEAFASYISERTNGQESRTWSSGVANFYSERYRKFADGIDEVLKKQGFHFK
ncbi:NADPH-dependent oxidoreductase [Texcoconibacillus texcoconensis]|uniref:FMN reductase [NAD(P)H] n=1 Tax=Texcoconibacillus texcoconensis TaxID=1095777 RepID=A0A840QMH2_9BACI|nr:NADPH-dependent oxidoreductase [Texcoconibacillus texcoconensis]MBB5172543.1 FMN reductase [NAD(P)H] [Texcoconibacillus texcoconensis]